MDNSYIKDTLINLGYSLRDFGVEWRTSSLYRSGNNSTALSIKKNTGDFYDYVLKKGGNFKELILLSKGEVNEEQLKNLQTYKEKPTIKIQKIYDKFILNKLVQNHSYWTNRNIDLETIKLFQGGICTEGKQKNRYIFPIFDEKQNLIGSSGRWLGEKNDSIPKYKHLGNKGNWLYPVFLNKKELLEKKEVILVEGVGCLLSLFSADIKNVICCFGTEISKTILQWLLKYNFQKIIISFNNESSNRGNEAAQKGLDLLLKYFDNQNVIIKLPIKKDFNEMTKEQILEWKNNL